MAAVRSAGTSVQHKWLSHPLFEIEDIHLGESRQSPLTIMDLDGELEKDTCDVDSNHRLTPIIFFDFDDTLHHTSTSAKLAYHDRLTGDQLTQLEASLAAEGVHFNRKDPLMHPGLLDYLRHLRSTYGSVLLLSAGSGLQNCGMASAVEITLFTNYARLWFAEYGSSLFDVVGTDRRLLATDARYLSPSAFRFRDQLVPPVPQQATIDALFTRIDEWFTELQSSPGRVNELGFVMPAPSPETASILAQLATNTSYFYYRGVIPVSGTKRDAMIRYLYQVYLSDPNAFLDSRICVYFVDDQLRYLQDVADCKSALILTSLQRECPEFANFILSDRFTCKVFLMPQFRPRILSH